MMAEKTKHISLPEAEIIARAATRDVLAQHPEPSWFGDPNLTLGTFFPDADHYEFSLYIAADKPSDGVILTTATVDKITGAVGVALHTSEWIKLTP